MLHLTKRGAIRITVGSQSERSRLKRELIRELKRELKRGIERGIKRGFREQKLKKERP